MAMLKNYLFLRLLGVTALVLSACSDDDPLPEPIGGEEFVKTGILTEDETWSAENVYILDGRVVVGESVTLTIEPGTIIKAKEGQTTAASALIVDQGGKLIANGTSGQPIIFTSILDNIQPGQKSGTNLTTADVGLWGGIIILGRAPISVSGDVGTSQIEGIPANEPYGQYGGDNPNDNSGSLQYVSIRHGGVSIGSDNEINGLTLGGVGSGTTLRHIEIVANLDDGIEWFGGTVNASDLLVWASGDDALDVDQAYSGTISNALIIQGSEPGSALELDGPEGETTAATAAFTMDGLTILGNSGDGIIADLRDGVLANLKNVLVLGVDADAHVNVKGSDSFAELEKGNITFSNWEILLPEGASIENLIKGAGQYAAAFTSQVTAIASIPEATVGANLSAFGWTYAAQHQAF